MIGRRVVAHGQEMRVLVAMDCGGIAGERGVEDLREPARVVHFIRFVEQPCGGKAARTERAFPALAVVAPVNNEEQAWARLSSAVGVVLKAV